MSEVKTCAGAFKENQCKRSTRHVQRVGSNFFDNVKLCNKSDRTPGSSLQIQTEAKFVPFKIDSKQDNIGKVKTPCLQFLHLCGSLCRRHMNHLLAAAWRNFNLPPANYCDILKGLQCLRFERIEVHLVFCTVKHWSSKLEHFIQFIKHSYPTHIQFISHSYRNDIHIKSNSYPIHISFISTSYPILVTLLLFSLPTTGLQNGQAIASSLACHIQLVLGCLRKLLLNNSFCLSN